MQLVYLDESGNTGANFADPQQPVFVLCALMVAEDNWQKLDADLRAILDAKIPDWKTKEKFEVHAKELRSGGGCFCAMAYEDRLVLRDDWMKAGINNGVQLVYRSVNKKAYANWLSKQFGGGVIVHPYVAAFALVSRCIDNHLATLPGKPMGILIADENKEIVADIEKSISIFRETTGTLRFSRIIEKGFFIESHKSLPLQLCDLFAFSLRKGIESRLSGKVEKPTDKSGIDLAKSITLDDHQHDGDVMQWLVKKHAPASKLQAVPLPEVTPPLKVVTDSAQKNSGQGINPGSIETGP